jgi:phage tail sheath protein FI
VTTLGAAVRREVQLVAGVPLPAADAVALDGLARVHAADDLLRFLEAGGYLPGPAADLRCPHDAFVQLCYPWLRTHVSGRLPGALEPPDGVLVGMLARGALTRGAFRSVAGTRSTGIVDVFPVVARARLEPPNDAARPGARALPERVSLFAPTPAGFALLSDVTTSPDAVCRSAGVKRLLAIVVRAARRLGEESVFDANGEALWARLRDGLNDLLLALLREGALRGRSPQDAFDVRCDRSTMTQQDLDQGRVVCEIRIQPSVSIERITVVLALEDGGQVSLAASAGVLEAA